ncbi:agmatine/peptidylarginine deiminase [Microbulbifer sp. VTAC004]|uniref:agmatine deiminase family protein n=1 Tax=Microbulbifer sp. VTAC004 TaxID=3243386 RepID=UPI004039DEC4
MIDRRLFIKISSLLLAAPIFAKKSLAMQDLTFSSLHMPDESDQHKRTWMAFVANDYIWSHKQIPEVKRNLALIANTIAKYEPVSLLVSRKNLHEAEELLDIDNSNFKIELHTFEVDDLWLRDTAPIFVRSTYGEKIALNFNFNGWGNKQEHSLDKQVARYIANTSGAIHERANIVLEGGCFEVDGNGTAIMTESCILNKNRNPGWSKIDIEKELKTLLGLRKIIWLKGIKGMDITDGHTDFYARFIKPGEVIVSRDNYQSSYDYEVTRENINTLSNSVDANGNPLNLHVLDTPEIINERFGTKDFAAGYIGYYVCNGAIIAQKFGDRNADEKARAVLQSAFPNHIIEQIAIDGIASGGGSVHCSTQQEIIV